MHDSKRLPGKVLVAASCWHELQHLCVTPYKSLGMCIAQSRQTRSESRHNSRFMLTGLGQDLHNVKKILVSVLATMALIVFLCMAEPNSRNDEAEGAKSLKTPMQSMTNELSSCASDTQQSVVMAQFGTRQGDDCWQHVAHA